MTKFKKELNNLTLADAIKIVTENKVKIDFNTSDSDIKRMAREIIKSKKVAA